jgi:hypothetical protein
VRANPIHAALYYCIRIGNASGDIKRYFVLRNWLLCAAFGNELSRVMCAESLQQIFAGNETFLGHSKK